MVRRHRPRRGRRRWRPDEGAAASGPPGSSSVDVRRALLVPVAASSSPGAAAAVSHGRRRRRRAEAEASGWVWGWWFSLAVGRNQAQGDQRREGEQVGGERVPLYRRRRRGNPRAMHEPLRGARTPTPSSQSLHSMTSGFVAIRCATDDRGTVHCIAYARAAQHSSIDLFLSSSLPQALVLSHALA